MELGDCVFSLAERPIFIGFPERRHSDDFACWVISRIYEITSSVRKKSSPLRDSYLNRRMAVRASGDAVKAGPPGGISPTRGLPKESVRKFLLGRARIAVHRSCLPESFRCRRKQPRKEPSCAPLR